MCGNPCRRITIIPHTSIAKRAFARALAVRWSLEQLLDAAWVLRRETELTTLGGDY